MLNTLSNLLFGHHAQYDARIYLKTIRDGMTEGEYVALRCSAGAREQDERNAAIRARYGLGAVVAPAPAKRSTVSADQLSEKRASRR